MRRSVAFIVAVTITIGTASLVTGSLGTAAAGAATGGGGGQADAAGVINFPVDLTGLGGIKFDPIAVASPNDWYVQQFVYDSLLRQNIDGSYSPGLAKSATVVDPQTIEIELQPNVKFSDGTPMNADAVKFSIERTMASGNVGAVRADYFWGWGSEAEAQAGRMKQPLRIWVLWPRAGTAASTRAGTCRFPPATR